MDTLLIKGWLYILGGVIAIGIGGVMSTFGWQSLNERSQMRNLICGVAREWEINNILLNDPLFVSDDKKLQSSYMFYQRFKSSALNNVLISGLFNSKNKQDRDFIRQVADYENVIKDTNDKLDMTNNFVHSMKNADEIIKQRNIVRRSTGFNTFIAEHMKMKKILDTHYIWVKDSKFLD